LQIYAILGQFDLALNSKLEKNVALETDLKKKKLLFYFIANKSTIDNPDDEMWQRV